MMVKTVFHSRSIISFTCSWVTKKYFHKLTTKNVGEELGWLSDGDWLIDCRIEILLMCPQMMIQCKQWNIRRHPSERAGEEHAFEGHWRTEVVFVRTYEGDCIGAIIILLLLWLRHSSASISFPTLSSAVTRKLQLKLVWIIAFCDDFSEPMTVDFGKYSRTAR